MICRPTDEFEVLDFAESLRGKEQHAHTENQSSKRHESIASSDVEPFEPSESEFEAFDAESSEKVSPPVRFTAEPASGKMGGHSGSSFGCHDGARRFW